MAAKKDITLEEFVEKYIPCWDLFRYNLTSRKLYNRIEPYITKDFSYSAKDWLSAWNKWKSEEDACIDGWIAGGNASLMYKVLRDLCQQNPPVELKEPENAREIFDQAFAGDVGYYWNSLSDLLVDVPNGSGKSNIVWDTSNYVNFSDIQRLEEKTRGQTNRKFFAFLNSLSKLKIWYHPIKFDDYRLVFDRLVLRSDAEKLSQDLDVSPNFLGVSGSERCKNCKVCPTVKKTSFSKQKNSTKIKKKSSLEKIQSFLDSKSKTNPLDSFSTADISKELSLPSYSCTVPIRELLQKGKVKIVDFKNGNRPYPVYQSIKGSLPSKEIITEGSLSLDLMSVTEYCKMNDLKPVFIKDILQEAENQGIKGYYTYSSDKGTGGSRGYFYKYKKIDLDRIISQTLKDKELPTLMVEPALFPESQEQRLFKPKNLFKKVLSFFGYKFNFSITVAKKKTVANTGQDLIDF